MGTRQPLEQRTSGGMYYRQWGEPEARSSLVLCHGLASNSTRWTELARNIQLPPGWKLLCPDLRGHGQSHSRGKLDSRMWMDDLEAMLDQAGSERSVIGGHCMGANLALRMAHARPQHCQGLVLIEPMLPQARVGRMRLKTPLRWLLPGLSLGVRLLNALGIKRRTIGTIDLEQLDRQTRRQMNQAGSQEAMLKRYAVPLKDLDHMATAAYLQALTETLRALPAFQAIAQPSLALVSKGGLFGDPDKTRRALTDLPEVEIVELDAVHWIPTEQPEALRTTLERWLLTRFS
jgi:pimeloyl-ACP methyl ester carboxylesterase